MATTYTPNPIGIESPASGPRIGIFPTTSIPADGDSLNAASVSQGFKVHADYLAYLNAPGRSTFNEDWMLTFSDVTSNGSPTNNPAWTYTLATNGTLSYKKADTAYNWNYVSLTTTAGAARSSVLAGPYIEYPTTGNTYLIMEWSGGVTAPDVAHAQIRSFGLSDDPLNASGFENAIKFINTSNASANWSCNTTNNGSASNGSSGVAVATSASPDTRFRIEFFGTNIPTYGGHAFFYINGTPVGDNTTNLPYTTLPATSGKGFVPFFGIQNAASSTTMTTYVGNVRISWMRYTGQL